MEKPELVAGAQSLRRGLSILRLLSANHLDGLRLREISEHLDLERSTAHRLLACLCEEQFVEKSPTGKHYHLGLASMQLGFASSQRIPLVERYRPVMQRLARISGDTVFLVARQGDYAICLHCEEGHFPVKITTTVVGGTRPLGIGAGGNALLAAMDDQEIVQLYRRHQTLFETSALPQETLLQSLGRTRRNGYAETIDVISQGITAVGALIPLGEHPFAAISIGGISSRMDARRRAELGQLLREALTAP